MIIKKILILISNVNLFVVFSVRNSRQQKHFIQVTIIRWKNFVFIHNSFTSKFSKLLPNFKCQIFIMSANFGRLFMNKTTCIVGFCQQILLHISSTNHIKCEKIECCKVFQSCVLVSKLFTTILFKKTYIASHQSTQCSCKPAIFEKSDIFLLFRANYFLNICPIIFSETMSD